MGIFGVNNPMNALTEAITAALSSNEDNTAANKAYLEFIKANFIIPLEKDSTPESPKVLFLQEQQCCYLPVFTERAFLDVWASDISEDIQLLSLSGVNLLKGLGEDVFICLDIGSLHYKIFHPEETARMRSMVLKLFK